MCGHAPVGQLTALTSNALASKASLQSSGQEGHVAERRLSESVVATVDHASGIAIGLSRMRGHRLNCCQRQHLAVPLLLCISLGRHGPLAFTQNLITLCFAHEPDHALYALHVPHRASSLKSPTRWRHRGFAS
jgi:hypothetical protein